MKIFFDFSGFLSKMVEIKNVKDVKEGKIIGTVLGVVATVDDMGFDGQVTFFVGDTTIENRRKIFREIVDLEEIEHRVLRRFDLDSK